MLHLSNLVAHCDDLQLLQSHRARRIRNIFKVSFDLSKKLRVKQLRLFMFVIMAICSDKSKKLVGDSKHQTPNLTVPKSDHRSLKDLQFEYQDGMYPTWLSFEYVDSEKPTAVP